MTISSRTAAKTNRLQTKPTNQNKMKTHAKFIFVTVAMALYAAVRAFANDPQLQMIDNHHGTYIYLSRPGTTGTTIAFGGHPKRSGGMAYNAKSINPSPSEAKSEFREVTTPHGTVSYFAPAE
jgi:hypothetical protein